MRTLVAHLQNAIGAAGGVDVVSGPTVVTGIYADGLDTTASVQLRPSVSPDGKSPSSFLEWSTAMGAAGPVFDPANAAGRFTWNIRVGPKENLRLNWQGAAMAPNLAAIIEHDPKLY